MLSIDGRHYGEVILEMAEVLCGKLFPGEHDAKHCHLCDAIVDDYLSPVWDHGADTMDAAWRAATAALAAEVAGRVEDEVDRCFNDDDINAKARARVAAAARKARKGVVRRKGRRS
jgi:hypothetical protein